MAWWQLVVPSQSAPFKAAEWNTELHNCTMSDFIIHSQLSEKGSPENRTFSSCSAVLCSGLLPLIRTMWRPGIFLALQLALLLGFACSSTGSEARNAKAQLGASRRQGYRFFDCCFDNFRAASRWGHRFDYIPRQRRNNSRTLSIDYVKPRHVPNGSNCSFIELFSTHLHHLVSILVAIKSRIVTNFHSSWMTHYVPDYIVAITIEVIMNAFQILSAATPLKYKLQLGFTIYWRILTDKIKLKFIL